MCCRELTVISTNLNTSQKLLINADSLFGTWYHIIQSGIRSMRGWYSTAQSCGHVWQTASIWQFQLCIHVHTVTYTGTNTHTPSVFNQAAKDFNEPQAFFLPLESILYGPRPKTTQLVRRYLLLWFFLQETGMTLINSSRLRSCFCNLRL